MKIKLVIMFLFVFVAGAANAQQTALAIFGGVDQVMTGLNDLEQKVDGTIAKSINQASQNLSAHEQELKSIIGSKITEPIENLNINLQNQLRLLKNTADNLNQFLSWQQECIFKNADQFKAGLLTAGLQLESNIRFIGKTNASFVSSLSFDGKPSYVVPLNGGRLTIKGFKLYSEFAPSVKIYDQEQAKVLLDKINVGRGASENDVSVFIDKSFIAQHLGEVIYFEIIPRKARWLTKRPADQMPVYIPLKIPEVTKYRYKLRCFIDYKWTKNEFFELKDQPWGKEETNSNCGETRAVSDFHTWNICEDCVIVNVKGGQTEERNMNDGGGINFTIPEKNRIAYAGNVGRPTCVKVWPVNKLIKHAYWRFSVWPEIKKVTQVEEQQNNISSEFILDETQKNVLVAIPVTENPRKQSVFWYELIMIDSGKEQTIYTSPRYTSDDNGVMSDTHIKNDGYRFDATLNNRTANSTVQVAFKITAPPCGTF